MVSQLELTQGFPVVYPPTLEAHPPKIISLQVGRQNPSINFMVHALPDERRDRVELIAEQVEVHAMRVPVSQRRTNLPWALVHQGAHDQPIVATNELARPSMIPQQMAQIPLTISSRKRPFPSNTSAKTRLANCPRR